MHDLMSQILDSNRSISLQLREVMQRHTSQIGTDLPETSNRSPGGGDHAIACKAPSLYSVSQTRTASDQDDNASIKTTASVRSSTSMRSIAASFTFLRDLRQSRPYRRVWGAQSDSNTSTLSFFSLNSVPTRGGSWSLLEAISLGDMSISELSVLELPLDCSDVWPWDSDPQRVASHNQERVSRAFTVKIKPPRRLLQNAISTGNSYLVRSLVAAGANLEDLDELGLTPLLRAIHTKNIKAVRALLASGAKMDVVGTGQTPSERRDENISDPALRQSAFNESEIPLWDVAIRSPLRLAISVGNWEAFGLLLDTGADVDEITSMDTFALAHAVHCGSKARVSV